MEIWRWNSLPHEVKTTKRVDYLNEDILVVLGATDV